MRRNKYKGLTKKKQEERQARTVARQRDGVLQVASSLHGDVAKFEKEWAEKFNALSKQTSDLGKFTVQQLGILSGNQQAQQDGIEGIDRNILALAEVTKVVFVHLEILDHKMGVLAEKGGFDWERDIKLDFSEIRQAAETSYKAVLSKAFASAIDIVRKNQQAREKAAKEAAEALDAARKKEIEAQEQAAKEAKVAEEEAKQANQALLDAELDARKITSSPIGGGQGSPIPDGAQVFGG